jgi:hypothetical protein
MLYAISVRELVLLAQRFLYLFGVGYVYGRDFTNTNGKRVGSATERQKYIIRQVASNEKIS